MKPVWFATLLLACGGLLIETTMAQVPTLDTSTQRLIVLTDIGNEPDDAQSMVRLLLYANEIDIEGLIASTSRHLPNTVNPDLIHARIDAYAASLANLRTHDPRYPSAAHLRSLVSHGHAVYGMQGIGVQYAGKPLSPAAQLIMAAVDRDDPRPLWVAIWGGARELAQVLWHVRATRSAAAAAAFIRKLRVYSISDQDDTGAWARTEFPELFWVTSLHGFGQYYLGTWIGISAPLPGADQAIVSAEWLSQNIVRVGALGSLYPLPAYIMEGDTPSFLNLIPNGLSVSERPDWGGWGGRYEKLSTHQGVWAQAVDTVPGIDGRIYRSPQASIWRWREALQNDFAARMQWSADRDGANTNHPPRPVLNGITGTDPVEIDACAGRPVRLSAALSTDPDGDALTHHWRWYREPTGLFSPEVQLSAASGSDIEVSIGDTARVHRLGAPQAYRIHILLETRDHGTPALTRYRRAILHVPAGALQASNSACQVRALPPAH